MENLRKNTCAYTADRYAMKVTTRLLIQPEIVFIVSWINSLGALENPT